MVESMASKTQVANNRMGTYGNMKKYTEKSLYLCIKHAAQSLLHNR